jgi:hypothetical protein
MSVPAPDAPTLSWSTGRTKTTANWSPIHDQSWSSFVQWLRPDMPAAKKEVLPYVGGTLENGRRTIRTVEERHLLTLDADYAHEQFPLDVALEFLDVPYLIHSTWRHSILAHRYRLVIPLSRGVNAKEYKEIAWTVMNRLDGKRFDVTTAQAERFMWGPSTNNPDEYFWVSANPRAPYLPVDEWLDGQHGPSDAPAGNGQGNPPPARRATGSGRLTASQEHKDRALEILAQACDQVEHVYEREDFAGRNEAVFHLMPLLIRFCDAGALEEDTVLDALWTAAQRVPADERYERSEFNASLRKAREYADESGPILPETTPTKMAQADFEDIDLEADLWDKTPRLKHIAQAGDALGRNRLALLAATLARVLAEVPAGVYLPGSEDGYVGSRAALNLGVALVGSSGQGKTMLGDMSMSLLGVDQRSILAHPSTGQGLIQAYLKWDVDEGQNVLIDDPRRLFIADEIDTLGALSKDTGSTLFGEMRTLLTGGDTGSQNATRDRQRKLHKGTYNFQLITGVQPARAGVLLEGRDAGTPQRFVWVPVTDPKTALHPDDRPKWPGVIGWNSAFLLHFDLNEPIVHYPKWVRDELVTHDFKVSQEDSHGGELSKHGHLNLLRLKVAAGIAFLHESVVIEDLHIEIADLILASSKRTQLMCERAVAEVAHDRKRKAKESDEQISGEVLDARLERMVTNARNAVLRGKGEWVSWNHGLRPNMGDREKYGDAVWEALVDMEDVETDEKQHGQRVRRQARIKNE